MRTSIVILVCALTTVGCQATSIKPEAAVAASSVSVVNPIDEIIGKRLVGDDGSVFLIGADGTTGGSIRGEDIVGVYTRTGNEMCSTYTSPKFLTDREFCSTPVIKKDTVVFNRRDGSKSPKYKIKE